MSVVPFVEMDLVGLDIDRLDLALVVVDALVELFVALADDVVGLGQTERHEQQTGLVDVLVVLVDDVDLQLSGRELLSKSVGGERAARAGSQNHHSLVLHRIDPFT